MSVKLSTRHLHYQKIGRSFFAEISDLPILARASIVADRITLVSHKPPGNEIELELVATKRDSDNDVIAWEYTPVNDDRITKVVILND